MEKKLVDARGLACPLPVVNAKKAAEELNMDKDIDQILGSLYQPTTLSNLYTLIFLFLPYCTN